MTTKTTLTNKLKMLGALALASTAPLAPAAEIAGNVKYFHAIDGHAKPYVEPNVFYPLPGQVRGYSWMDFNQDGSYFGKTSASRQIKGDLSAAVQVVHANEPFTQAGLGLKLNIPMKNKNAYGNIQALPVWANKDGTTQPGRTLLGYAFGTDMGNGWNLETFAEFDLVSARGKKTFEGKRKLSWGYGEVELTKKVAPGLKVGANIGLVANGSTPVPRLRLQARYDFNVKIGGQKAK